LNGFFILIPSSALFPELFFLVLLYKKPKLWKHRM
jgi:hypothetical protein